MKLPRDLSGTELVKALCRDWHYRVIHQEIILETNSPTHQRLSVPNHNPLRIGTLNSIIRTVSAHKNIERPQLLDTLR
jgi:hypothetical protein